MSTEVTVDVLYTCHGCGLTDRVVSVPERQPDDCVVQWVEASAILIGADHERVSPNCSCRHVDLKIPLRANPEKDPTVRIGEARRQ